MADSDLAEETAISPNERMNVFFSRYYVDTFAYRDAIDTQGRVAGRATFPVFVPTCFNRTATPTQPPGPFEQSAVSVPSPPFQPSHHLFRSAMHNGSAGVPRSPELAFSSILL
jgi:hypothetical protein